MSLMDVAIEPETIGGAVGHGDPNAGCVHIGHRMQPRSRWREVCRLDLRISGSEADYFGPLRLGPDEGNVPFIATGSIGEFPRRGVGDVLQLESEVTRDGPGHIRGDAGRLSGRRPAWDQKKVRQIDPGPEHAGGRQLATNLWIHRFDIRLELHGAHPTA